MLGRAPEPSPACPQASPPSTCPQTGLFPSQGPPQVCHLNLSHDSGQMKMSSSLAWLGSWILGPPKVGCPCRTFGISQGSLGLQETKRRLTVLPRGKFLQRHLSCGRVVFVLGICWLLSHGFGAVAGAGVGGGSWQLGTTAVQPQWHQHCFLPCSFHFIGLGPSKLPSCWGTRCSFRMSRGSLVGCSALHPATPAS